MCISCCRVCCFGGTLAGQQAGALLLGLVNVVGVITLSSMLMDPIAKLALYRQGLGFIVGLLPYLQTYAAAFFAMPLLRLFVDGRRNVAIDDRNDNRIEVGVGVYGRASLVLQVWSCRSRLAEIGLVAPVLQCLVLQRLVFAVSGSCSRTVLIHIVCMCSQRAAAGCGVAAEWGPRPCSQVSKRPQARQHACHWPPGHRVQH